MHCQNTEPMELSAFPIIIRKMCKISSMQCACAVLKGKGKAVPLQASSGPEGSRKLRSPDFMTTAQEGGKVVSLTHPQEMLLVLIYVRG
jgi:hypothetical protein